MLEADDVIDCPEIITLYARLVGLEPSKLKLEWQPIAQDELDKVPCRKGKSYISTIASSASVLPGKTSIRVGDKPAS